MRAKSFRKKVSSATVTPSYPRKGRQKGHLLSSTVGCRTTGYVKGYQMPARSPDSATRSEGRRLISIRGGNRGPGRVRRCRALELWGFEGHGQWAEAQAW